MKLKNFLWTLPFLCFIVTYTFLSLLFTKPTISTPSLIGLPLTDSFAALSEKNLNPRLLRQEVDEELPAGTILSQIPAPGQKIKPHQQIFLTVSKKPEQRLAPLTIGKQYRKVIKQLAQQTIRYKVFYITSKKPKGTVIAQLPSQNSPLTDNRMTLYISQGNNTPVLVPDFKDHTVAHVKQFLGTYQIAPRLYHTKPLTKEHNCSSCVVTGQQPLRGSIINLEKPISLQLKVQQRS